MAEYSICANCGNKLKDHWLVCKFCHQARWRRILPYYLGGITFLIAAVWCLVQYDNAIFLCAGALAGFLSAVMLLMGGIATLQGLTVRKVPTVPRTRAAPAASPPAPAAGSPAKPGEATFPPMVFRLSDGVLSGVDKTVLDIIDQNIRNANNEAMWEQLNFLPGQVDRGKIPMHTCQTIDYLLDEHKLTHETTLAHLFASGSDKLRATIIRILGAMATERVLPVLEAFARGDPWRHNMATEYNLKSGSSAPLVVEWGYPLRELAMEEIEKIRAGIKAG